MNDFKPKYLFFNQLVDHGDHYEKVSTNVTKLKEEYHFLSSIPEELSSYYPRVFNLVDTDSTSSYRIVKIPSPDASFLLLNKDHFPVEKINAVLDSVCDYLDKVPFIQSALPDYQKSILRNIYVRNLSMVREISALPQFEDLNQICRDRGVGDVHQYCDVLNQELRESFLKVKSKRLYYSHGDLRFANILPTEDGIFLIDPKGYLGDITNTYRTIYHDLAHVSSSILGRFDLINHELFEIRDNNIIFSLPWEGHDKVVTKFNQMLKDFGVEMSLVRKLEASLFLSLIPSHKESEKKILGLLMNSIKIFKES